MTKTMMLTMLAAMTAICTAQSVSAAPVAAHQLQQHNLVVNGGFEVTPNFSGEYVNLINKSMDVQGWKVHYGDVDVVQKPGFAAYAGTRCIDLDGWNPGGIYQRISTEPGATYQLSFWMSGNPHGTTVKRMNVRVAGKVQPFAFSIAGKDQSNMGWEQKSIQFTASEKSTTIEFLSADQSGCYGPVIDDVAVVKAQPVAVTIEPTIEQTETETILSMPTDILFDENQAVLRQSAVSALKAVYERDIRPNIGTHIRIKGYTDDSGESLYNLSLSSKRALAVASWLSTAGCNADMMEINGLGESNPKVPNTDEQRAMNRRVEIVLEKAASNVAVVRTGNNP